MTDLEPRLTRRALLGTGVLLLVGCRPHRTVASDPDAATLASVRAGELALLASYAEGTPDHAVHLAHLRALGGTSPSPGATPTPTSAAAYTEVRGSVPTLQAAALRARSGATAALLASVAASHAVLTAPAS